MITPIITRCFVCISTLLLGSCISSWAMDSSTRLELVWSKTYPSGVVDEKGDVMAFSTLDDSFFLAGRSTMLMADKTRRTLFWIRKLDMDGKILWDREIPMELPSTGKTGKARVFIKGLVTMRSGDLLMIVEERQRTSRYFLMHLDREGRLQLTHDLAFLNDFRGVHVMTLMNDILLAVGTTSGGQVTVVAMGENGALLSESTFKSDRKNFVTSACLAGGSRVILAADSVAAGGSYLWGASEMLVLVYDMEDNTWKNLGLFAGSNGSVISDEGRLSFVTYLKPQEPPAASLAETPHAVMLRSYDNQFNILLDKRVGEGGWHGRPVIDIVHRQGLLLFWPEYPSEDRVGVGIQVLVADYEGERHNGASLFSAEDQADRQGMVDQVGAFIQRNGTCYLMTNKQFFQESAESGSEVLVRVQLSKLLVSRP